MRTFAKFINDLRKSSERRFNALINHKREMIARHERRRDRKDTIPMQTRMVAERGVVTNQLVYIVPSHKRRPDIERTLAPKHRTIRAVMDRA